MTRIDEIKARFFKMQAIGEKHPDLEVTLGLNKEIGEVERDLEEFIMSSCKDIAFLLEENEKMASIISGEVN